MTTLRLLGNCPQYRTYIKTNHGSAIYRTAQAKPTTPVANQAKSFSSISGQTYTVGTSYNNLGQLTSYTHPDGTNVGRTYTARGELHQLKQAGTTLDTRTYDNGGRMTLSSYNNGVSESRSYNADSTLAGISYSGASIGNMSYAWDDNKNKTAESISGTMSNYGFSIPTNGYDSEDRLVSYNRTSGLNQSWNLSAVGDWNSFSSSGTSTQPATGSRTHGPTHELTAVAGQSLATDVKGNITAIPSNARPNNSSLGLSWDFDNRLVSADVGKNGSTEASHQYDALGRRVARTAGGSTTIYVQSGQQTIADYVAGAPASSPTYRYIYGSYIDEPVLRYQPSGSISVYYHRNQQYSIVALTNASGGLLERYAYTAYGAPAITTATGSVLTSSAHNNRYTYTGREWDNAIRLYHYRARMYDPYLGRFCSKDPIGYERVAWNLYAGYFATSAAMDPGGNARVWPWDPNARWWFPFNQPPNPINLVSAVFDTLCPYIQSNTTTCSCCLIEIGDLTSGVIGAVAPREVPVADEILNIADCVCDGGDALNALCATWNGTGTLPITGGIVAVATASCIINAIDVADITGLFADRILFATELLTLAPAQSSLNVAAGCSPCGKACAGVIAGNF